MHSSSCGKENIPFKWKLWIWQHFSMDFPRFSLELCKKCHDFVWADWEFSIINTKFRSNFNTITAFSYYSWCGGCFFFCSLYFLVLLAFIASCIAPSHAHFSLQFSEIVQILSITLILFFSPSTFNSHYSVYFSIYSMPYMLHIFSASGGLQWAHFHENKIKISTLSLVCDRMIIKFEHFPHSLCRFLFSTNAL